MSAGRCPHHHNLTIAVEYLDGAEGPMPDTWFERLAQSVAAAAGVPAGAAVVVLLADDATLQRLNHAYRHIDAPTDVLSFAQQDGGHAFQAPSGAPRHLGDVAISVERARRQAAALGHSFERELAYLCVHGLLHLLGYDHQADADQAAMRRVEEAALAAAGLPRDHSRL